MIIKENWSKCLNIFRNDIINNHSNIEIVDFDFYNTEVFNQCENNNFILMAISK